MQCYRRLSLAEREELSRCFAQGHSLRYAARRLRRHPSTISRELRRTNYSKATYRMILLVPRRLPHRSPRRFLKIERHPALKQGILQGLRVYWSPQQIAIHLKKTYPKPMQLSHETIYQYLYVLGRGALKHELRRYLRHQRPYRRNHLTTHDDRRGKIPEMLSIEERPQEVAARSVPGHWEGDLLMGSKASNSAVGVLVERKTRFLLLVPLQQKDAESVRIAFAHAIQRLPDAITKSLTYDQGTEMYHHQRFTLETHVTVYFCHPHSPWERGTCENTNGLLRQFFPKGKTNFKRIPVEAIRHVEHLMNGRPRMVLGGLTPSEVLDRVLR